MARVKFYLDKRVEHSDGRYPLKLNISQHGRTALLSLNIYLSPEQWDEKNGKVIMHPNRAAFNAILVRRKADAEILIADLAASGKLRKMSPTDIRRAIAKDANPENEKISRDVLSVFEDMISHKGKETAGVYRGTLTRLKEFCPNLNKIHFEDINVRWITDFHIFVAKYAPAINSQRNHLRVLRTLFNYAIDNEITDNYPFKRIKIHSEPTRKRALTLEQMRSFIAFPTNEKCEKYKMFFILIFLLRGINIVDLLRLKSVNGDRIEYRRSKTKKTYSIKVEPEAYEIIERLKGKAHLLYPLDETDNYKTFSKHLNEEIKKIGAQIQNFPDITSYWARHTWATIAASLDIPKETIAAGLGHSGNTVTDIYIDFDMRKVDDANRRIIDWVFYGKK